MFNLSTTSKHLTAIALAVSFGMVVSASSQAAQVTDSDFVQLPENYVELSPTVGNADLDFEDDSNTSCCARTPDGKTRSYYRVPKNENEKNNRLTVDINASGPQILFECNKYANLSELVSNQTMAPEQVSINKNYGITSRRAFKSGESNVGFTNRNHRSASNTIGEVVSTGNFHVSGIGGSNHVDFQNVANYSVCMARGGNVLDVRNTDNGSILTYNGADRVHLAGNNTNMLTRTGGGNDIIEIEQADPVSLNQMASSAFRGEKWSANNVYRTAVSGREGIHTLLLSNTPLGTKWCHIGDSQVFGELFHIVEFALPPSAVVGPRRQRINIGNTVEYVIFNGKKYDLEQFLNNGFAEGDMQFTPESAFSAVGYERPATYTGSGAGATSTAGQPLAMPVVTTGTFTRGFF
jgi:hypothetical protein